MTDKRKRIENLINEFYMRMDPTGINARKYKDMFQTMDDKRFEEWITKFLADEKSNFRLDIEEFGDGSRSLKFENVEKAAELLNIKLFEYVYMPHISSNPNRPVRTRQPVLVGNLNIKRPQQFVRKKTGLALTDTDRDELGMAKGESKGGTTTGIENQMLAGVGGEIILSEIIGSRGDNVSEYNNMISSISETGSVKLSDIKTSMYDKPTLLKADLFFMAMGLKTDLITPSYYSIDKVKSALSK